MTLSDFAALGEAVGGFAVLVSFVYLAYQLRQTATLERTAGQRELLSRCRNWVELTTVHEGLAPVLQKALADWDAATPEEKERTNGWALSAALQAEQAMYMWREGLINEVSYRGFIEVAVAIAATPGGRRWWASARIPLGDDISNLIDHELETRPPDAPHWTQIFPHMGPSSGNEQAET